MGLRNKLDPRKVPIMMDVPMRERAEHARSVSSMALNCFSENDSADDMVIVRDQKKSSSLGDLPSVCMVDIQSRWSFKIG